MFEQLLIIGNLLLTVSVAYNEGDHKCFSFDSSTVPQLQEDEGLRKQCTFMNGQYTPRGPLGDMELEGDKCEMEFLTHTKNALEAKDFCELYAPWRLVKAEHGVHTKCHVEATVMCQTGWIQMFGRCYKLFNNRRYNYEEAEQKCKSEQAQLPSLHHRYIVGVWKRYFTKARQFWVTSSEVNEKNIQLTIGDKEYAKTVLALYGQHYEFSVPFNSLIKVPGSMKFQVLCEYDPLMTMAELRYVTKRYGEIYYQPITVNGGFIIRSTSYYKNYPKHPDPFHQCLGYVRAFNFKKPATYSPYDQSRLDYMDSEKLGDIYFTNSGGGIWDYKNNLDSKGYNCKRPRGEYMVFTLPGSNNETKLFFNGEKANTCNNMRSAAVMHFPGRKNEFKVMPDSRDAPIVCEMGARPYKLDYLINENFCPYAKKMRLVGHYRHWTENAYQGGDYEYCKVDGDFLTGFETKEEMDILQDLFRKHNKFGKSVWVGGTKKQECRLPNQVNFNDPKGPCYKGKAFEWKGGVAQNYPTDDMWATRKDGVKMPDFSDPEANCVAMVYGHPNYNSASQGIFLINARCKPSCPQSNCEYGAVCGRRLEFMPR